MRILVLGSGARENALYHALHRSHLSDSVYVMPGNAGSPPNSLVRGVPLTDFDAVLSFVAEKNIDLVVVGPEEPLARGIKDFFSEKKPGVRVFAPDKKAAQLEASKCFAAEYMKKTNIPTAESQACHSWEDSLKVLEKHPLPVVVKVDGLAAGKGVSIHHSKDGAKGALKNIFLDQFFGDAGKSVLIQSFMQGREVSLFAICNGKEAIYLPNAQDYKPAWEGDQGPNTGGMGAYSPAKHLTEAQVAFAHKRIVTPILNDFSYTGVLYIGLMVHSEHPEDISVVEFNCRFGDPELQTILPLLEADIVPYILWSCGHSEMIPKVKASGFYHLPFKNEAAVNVVLAAQGYPGAYSKEIPFTLPPVPENLQVIHGATAFAGRQDDHQGDQYISQGGRILNIIGTAQNIDSAREMVYGYIEQFKKQNADQISKFHFRKDIASVTSIPNSKEKMA